jgi:hypothetical protein
MGKFEKHGETLPKELFGGVSASALALDDGRSHAFEGVPRP